MPDSTHKTTKTAITRITLLGLLLLLLPLAAIAQINIGGSIYGGGNQGDVGGNATVTVRAGDLDRVFGGARMANVGGRSFVHIDGQNASDYILINYVYGGNDISGTIGSSTVPELITDSADNPIPVNYTWNTFVRVTPVDASNTRTAKVKVGGVLQDQEKTIEMYFGQLFGGGNGDYYYSTTPDGEGKYVVKASEGSSEVIATSTTPFNRPDLDKTYLDLLGGSIVNIYGGGNNATVRKETVIHLDNPTEVVNDIPDENGVDLVTKDNRPVEKMGLNPGFTYPSSAQFQIGSLFGGNNTAEMAIRPKWQLKQGKVRNLYSGGNRGRMTSPEGLLLVINPESDDLLHIGDVYGGCRMADVCPSVNGIYTPTTNIEPYHFPDEFAARLLIYGGTINNVYGGNDITGKVYGGNAVGIYSDILGNVYGGGNGSYPYTDNAALINDPTYADLYYNPGASSVDALAAFRPNAEQVSLRLHGTAADPTIVRGSVYLGGNSASLKPNEGDADPLVELKIGSYVIANNVFLGNNGENMVKTDTADLPNYIMEGVLRTMPRTDLSGNGTKFNSIDLKNSDNFAKYMDAVAMEIMPRVVFDNQALGDPDTYIDYTTYIGSFFCGGNRGSMIRTGCQTIDFNHKVIIFDKLVGGCNNAIVDEVPEFNARYLGGIIKPADAITGNKLELNLSGLKVEPKRWKEPYNESATTYPDKYLEWHTVIDDESVPAIPPGSATPDSPEPSSPEDLKRRFEGGNIYGGCYSSGIVEGNVVINLNASIVEREKLFDVVLEDTLGESVYYSNDTYHIIKRNTGVILGQQGMDVLGKALNVFGGGFGAKTEIWGSTTVNLNRGYTFQIFGGSQEGIIGKSREDAGETPLSGDYVSGTDHFTYNPDYSCYVNLRGPKAGVSKKKDSGEDMAECEFLYGGGFVGLICGNTVINLGKGRIFNSFAGSCNADILGHTETYIGRHVKDSYKNILGANVDNESAYEEGFPWVRDYVYGGNDLGGEIKGSKDFTARVRSEVLEKVHDYSTSTSTSDVLTATSYLEYLQGRATGIYGGSYGVYDYTDHEYKNYFFTAAARDNDGNVTEYDEGANAGNLGKARPGYSKPILDRAFINFRPSYVNQSNKVERIFGACEGIKDEPERDMMQNSSYILIDIPQVEDTYMKYYEDMEVFGAGAYGGVGMKYDKAETEDSNFNLNNASAVIDLMRGKIKDVFGGSYEEGTTRRTVVNVPDGSTIRLKRIFGGACGLNPLIPCDVYEAHVNYHSEAARIEKIFGGNNTADRTLYGQINIDVPVWSDKEKGYQATVFGAGLGKDTWSQYTEVNLLPGAQVYEVYGGGNNGMVMNTETLRKWRTDEGADLDLSLPGYEDEGTTYTDKDSKTFYLDHGLNSPLVKAGLDGNKYNTNVLIHEGAIVGNYAYGGGLGADADVSGTTYVALLGGTVKKDIYAAGTSGAVLDYYNARTFTASATAYIAGGTCRNVYGGGWEGAVGKHAKIVTQEGKQVEVDAAINEVSNVINVQGETNVVIGKIDGTSLTDGIPAIKRNVYGGGEGGAVFGTTNVTLRNGYIGYEYNSELSNNPDTELDDRYEEKIVDETWKDKDGNFIPNTNLVNSGNIFGGGYIDNSYVDSTRVTLYGGYVRNSVFGGGEIAAIGRGTAEADDGDSSKRTNVTIYGAGKTHIYMYDGHVMRNVFGGGKGIDNLGRIGTLNTDGYVFGQTDVNIYGGEIGTEAGMAQGYGNVFGGGDIGFVYSAYANESGVLCFGKSSGDRYDDGDEGYYYEYENGAFKLDNEEKILTEDCHVLIEPNTKVLASYEEPVLDGENKPVLDGEGKPMTNTISVTNVTINGHTYTPGQYVPINDLNTLQNKNSAADIWNKLDVSGIIIHNAVFAGGNVSSGSDQVHANTYTVYGNATASINDVYHRDLITLGTGHTGGLYGDGNLTFVDGYRELNITNYGTDYYSISKEVTIDDYHNLPVREQAYYELKYKCLRDCTDKDGTRYTSGNSSSKASTITADDLLVLFLDETESGTAVSVEVDADGNRVTSGTPVLVKEDEKWVPNHTFWEENGVLPVYAGRLMNSIQRADFCGVFGSRMVMQGARDRVPEVVDFTNYTINRVREVSLNKQISTAGDSPSSDAYMHGNYFGIYNIVNYLGALTSDFDFGDGGAGEGHGDIRTTDNNDGSKYKCPITVTSGTYNYGDAGYTYYNWKEKFVRDRRRNNGNSHNKLALASGVYLELTTEKSTGPDLYEKDWGTITGVIELDLINVKTGIGGGFVYARNEHGVRSRSNKKHITLTALNRSAVTQDDFNYTKEDATKKEWQTSGNFVHSSQIIIDDCYNISEKYLTNYNKPDGVPAHYWYIKGSVYVYDQYISAYTGAPNAYRETVEIPLTITAASHGTMKLLNVQPNRYAYYAMQDVAIEPEKKVIINDVTYYKNTPISYWDWSLLSSSEQKLFVGETYVTIADCKIGETEYPAGTVLLPADYNTLKAANDSVFHVGQNKKVAFDYVFRMSNNLSHDTGYLLTYEVNNPAVWNKYYTPNTGNSLTGKISDDVYSVKNSNEQKDYTSGPTYTPKASGFYGQREYKLAEIISQNVYNTYQKALKDHSGDIPSGQAVFEPAYVVTQYVEAQKGLGENKVEQHLQKGAKLAKSEYTTDNWNAIQGSVAQAFVCTSTIQLSNTEYIYLDALVTGTERTAYIDEINTKIEALGISDANNITEGEKDALSAVNKRTLSSLLDIRKEIEENLDTAYYCSTAGLYGGDYYYKNNNYRALDTWSSMSEADRANFTFNYDALDLLIDPLYSKDDNGYVIHPEGQKYQYDSEAGNETGARANSAGYSLIQPVDYTAEYRSETPLALSSYITVNRYNETSKEKEPTPTNSIQKGDELTRPVFEESLINEQRHYAPISPKADDDYKVYVVNTPFQIGNTPYTVGQTISFTDYSSLGESDRDYITKFEGFSSGDAGTTFYYCREKYTIATDGHQVKSITGDTYDIGATVPAGTVIKATEETEGYTGFTGLTNEQKDFIIHGIAPTEVSTLYVSRESDIFDLSTEKIITVIYQYDYEESDASGNITPVTERHVVNIHLQFMSGIPTIEDIKSPNIVLPGTSVTLRTPYVTPGAYEILGGGWELFERADDAENHNNGIEYTPSTDPLYWYQDGYYVSYYAKTYLGKTYSNHVPVTVANYHDMKEVMDDVVNHLHVDYDPKRLKRDCKIYINDYTGESKDGLDQLKDFYDLSLLTESDVNTDANGLITTDKTTSEDSPFKGHALLNPDVRGGDNLEFFLRTDIDHSEPWTPIGETQCFGGTFHGDGHTISGLDKSLFDKLCGDVYNLGVMGTFVTAGVANSGDGYVENCWISTTGAEKTMKPVFDSPTILPGSDRPYRIVNCYYEEEAEGVAHPYTNHTGSYGIPTRKSKQAFYNGEVAYNLNGFYLYKRYSDQNFTEQPADGSTYSFYNVNADNTLSAVQTKYYGKDANLCSAGYVESRFADGDFRYADHSIPTEADERAFIDTSTGETSYYPIWPDDYIFFGQRLTYGHVEGSEHQPYPSVINYSDNRIVTDETGNRVYRAPAYFRSKQMKVAHYNPVAVFARTNDKNTITVHKDMTAIDFTGGNSDISSGYQKGSISAAPYAAIADGAFYPPLLDDNGLTSFKSVGLTSNLLVYTGEPGGTGQNEQPNATQKTANVVSNYLPDEAYSETHATYHTVAPWDSHAENVHGHWVKQTGVDTYTASLDHMLVDKQDFNAPIRYTFADGHRMWYQRMPDIYVGSLKDGDGKYMTGAGWDGISLPFKAEVVTTDVKGELTHFYDGSTAGHEYWLREFKGGQVSTSDVKVFEANLQYPAAKNTDGNKHYTNHFLWDYYYSYNDYDDLNRDDYQEDDKDRFYYKTDRDYADYPRFAAATPYIIGFPGERYYEFDLSGSFEATTAKAIIPAVLEAQTVTFASAPSNVDGFPAVTIEVSDDETATGVTPDGCSYTFKPSYLNEAFAAGTPNVYTLNDTGSSYDIIPAAASPSDPPVPDTKIYAFRPYFQEVVSTPAPKRSATRSIVFVNNGASYDIHGAYETDDPDDPDDPGRLTFNPGRHAIIATSSLRHEASVRIVNAGGLIIAEFTIQPGETIATPVNMPGVYIVNNKKIIVK